MDCLKKDIIDAMAFFSKEKRIFQNEAQFQQELALFLNNLKGENGCQKYKVSLEVLAVDAVDDKSLCEPQGESFSKYYIDLVVEDLERKCLYPIELKYKTPQKIILYYDGEDEQKPIGVTFSQGAPNVGSYMYWKDVERLERLLRKENNLHICYSDKRIAKGYALFLTNYSSYLRPYRTNQSSLYEEFFPYKKNVVEGELCAQIYIDDKGNRCKKSARFGTERVSNSMYEKCKERWREQGFYNDLLRPIQLIGKYNCEWTSYPLNDVWYSTNGNTLKELDDRGPCFNYLLQEIVGSDG